MNTGLPLLQHIEPSELRARLATWGLRALSASCRLHGCRTAGCTAPGLQSSRAPGLQGSRAPGLQAAVLQDSRFLISADIRYQPLGSKPCHPAHDVRFDILLGSVAPRLRCQAVRLSGCQAVRLHGCRAAGCTAAGLLVAGLQGCRSDISGYLISADIRFSV